MDARDVTTGEPLSFDDVNGVFVHSVDLFAAIADQEYFIKALEACELKMSQRIVESRKVEITSSNANVTPEILKDLSPKEYLLRTVIPALLPALESCQRYRPADPLEFIAFYMLRHQKQYNKTLKR